MKDLVWFGRPAWEVITWIIFVLIIVWGVKQEYRESHCYDGLADCGPVWAWDPKPGDQVKDLIRRLEFANRGETYMIVRRIVMIASAALALLLMWYFNKKRIVPNIVEYIIPFVIIMGVVWFTFRYVESHYLNEINRRMDLTLQELKYQTGVAERPTNL